MRENGAATRIGRNWDAYAILFSAGLLWKAACTPTADVGRSPAWALAGVEASRERGSLLALPSLSRLQTLAVYLDVTAGQASATAGLWALPGTVYVQTEVHYTNQQNDRYVSCAQAPAKGSAPNVLCWQPLWTMRPRYHSILRVATFPLRTAPDKATWLSTVDGDVAAVMLARLAVLEARASGAGDSAVRYLYGARAPRYQPRGSGAFLTQRRPRGGAVPALLRMRAVTAPWGLFCARLANRNRRYRTFDCRLACRTYRCGCTTFDGARCWARSFSIRTTLRSHRPCS